MRKLLLLALVLCAACSQGANAPATGEPPVSDQRFTLVIKDHQFNPVELDVPANTKFELLIVNEDATPEEFESHELNREKIVTGGGTIKVMIGPLKPGRYPFYGEFHMDTAKGALIAK